MKKRSLSLDSRPGPQSHTARSPYARLPLVPGREIARTPIEKARSDAQLEYGLQQGSRSCNPYSSQNQRSLSQTWLTQSQSTQRLSQDSQPEDYGCEQWKKGFQDKEISLSQPKPPSPYFAGLASSLHRRNLSGNVGGGSTPGSSTCTSASLCLAGPQNGTPRPWPQCNVSEDLEKRLGSLEKLREEQTALLRRICDDYQQIKTFLEETCFESRDNRSKFSLQQNALHKLLKEEETANSSMLTAIKVAEEAVLHDIRNLKAQQVAEGDASNKENLTTSFKLMAESYCKELADFKRDLIAELQAIKQPLPIEEVHHQLPNQLSHIQMDVTETTAKHSLVNSYLGQDLSISVPVVVDLDELSDYDRDAELAFLLRDDSYPACNTRSKTHNRLRCTDGVIRRPVRRNRQRAQKKVRCSTTVRAMKQNCQIVCCVKGGLHNEYEPMIDRNVAATAELS